MANVKLTASDRKDKAYALRVFANNTEMHDKDVVAYLVDTPQVTRVYHRECFTENVYAQYWRIINNNEAPEYITEIPQDENNKYTGYVQALTDYDDEALFGHICSTCRGPVADWAECKYCHSVFWPDSEGHMCDGLRAHLNDFDVSFEMHSFSGHPVDLKSRYRIIG